MKSSQLPTPAEIHAAYEAGEAAVKALVETQNRYIQELEARLQALEDALNKDSGNSSKPPSSDGLKKRQPKSLRKSDGKARGGQKGHRGYRLEAVQEPDKREVHAIASCECCQADLRAVRIDTLRKRQVFDLPIVRLEVTEHQAEVKTCPACGQVNVAEFPANVSQPTQYGPRLRAQLAYLNAYHFIPLRRTAEIVSELYHHPVSDGAIVAAVADIARTVSPVNEQVKAYLVETDTPVHFDETGVRVNGKLLWLHSASTEAATYYAVHAKRGGQAMRDIAILSRRLGWSVHDAWLPYLSFPAAQHALCNAHLLRELVFLAEHHQQDWAGDFIGLLLEMKTATDTAKCQGKTALSPLQRSVFERCYDWLLQAASDLHPPPLVPALKRGRRKQSPERNLIDRLIHHRHAILAFLHHLSVPFDNNLAERDIRMLKVQQKVSGGFRTLLGAHTFCHLRSYISTARKNGQCVLDCLLHALAGQPFLPDFLQ